jgi:hypothetical protein
LEYTQIGLVTQQFQQPSRYTSVLETDPPPQYAFNSVELSITIGCCVLSCLLFFFPLLALSVPISGEQQVSGYEVVSRIDAMRENFRGASSGIPSPSSSPTENSADGHSQSDLPQSIQMAWLIPIEIGVGFLCAVLTLVGASSVSLVRATAAIGVCSAALAILHITVMNSDFHSYLNFSGTGIGTFANAFQLKPGWGLYSLGGLLGVVAFLAYSRVFSRLTA